MKKKTNKPVSSEENTESTQEGTSKKKNDSTKNKSSQKDTDENFPGYPHYPATEDIFNAKEDKLPLVEEETTHREKNYPQSPDNKLLNEEPVDKSLFDEDEETRPETDADVTQEEILFLDSDNLNADVGDDDQLRNRVTPVDMSGDDLDVPGSELDDADAEIGEEDEENNPFSIGGDRHEDLEEPPL